MAGSRDLRKLKHEKASFSLPWCLVCWAMDLWGPGDVETAGLESWAKLSELKVAGDQHACSRAFMQQDEMEKLTSG